MKKTVLLLTLAFAIIALNAQDESPTLKGNKLINVGVGIFGWGGVNFYPIHVGIDFFIIDNLSLGFDVNWRLYKNNIYRHNIIASQAVLDYHFNQIMKLSGKWDFYAGIKIGPGYITDPDNDINTAVNAGVRLLTDIRTGIRYYINNTIAINAEGGVMLVSGIQPVIGAFTIGITTKL